MDSNFTFEDPWEALDPRRPLLAKLDAELCLGHPLYGKLHQALALRVDSDDLLVQTTDGYALVHLSWCRRSKPTPAFPQTRLFATWNAFVDEVYEPDLLAWREDNPSCEWEELLQAAQAPQES